MSMSEDRHKEIVRHLSEDDLDRLLAESTDEKLTERLIFIKRLYKEATLKDAADDVGSVLRHRNTLSSPVEQWRPRSFDAELRGRQAPEDR